MTSDTIETAMPTGSLNEKIKELSTIGQDIVFEDGIDTPFSRKLRDFITRDRNSAIYSLRTIIDRNNFTNEIVAEIYRWLGLMEDPTTHHARRLLLEDGLFAESAQVRDGAALGLSFMDDPSAIPMLRRAIEREISSILKEDMKQVLEQLEADR